MNGGEIVDAADRAEGDGPVAERPELPRLFARCPDFGGGCPFRGSCLRYRDPDAGDGPYGFRWVEFEWRKDLGCNGYIGGWF